ncbi:unnamed protein product (macronuclear) [Paramecium tetraurelia]|uniref:Tubulin/FtsZ GTPase domain-containing protein n=1 Tax=Paramecium tetraurelia TaxID=5888 RepID=A0BQ86_PARTE|nr:uncharacterized protein GSPATT00030932001 [Paramecium tetraurelia]CAK60703.1 unnamed protein product [Paramecium tetraurelia]|eukprot:XP_001428101.1 hypothetical protein (macronuclear) [Paramecium tetraurelia strain d4-2]
MNITDGYSDKLFKFLQKSIMQNYIKSLNLIKNPQLFIIFHQIQSENKLDERIISLYKGQAGIELGNNCWELFVLEHRIQVDGYSIQVKKLGIIDDAFQNFFSETGNNKHSQRSLFIDLDRNTIDELKRSQFRELFRPQQMILGKDSAIDIYAGGYYGVGKKYYRCRKIAWVFRDLQYFILLEEVLTLDLHIYYWKQYAIHEEFGKQSINSVATFPSPQIESSIIEPYNTYCVKVHQMIITMSLSYQIMRPSMIFAIGIWRQKGVLIQIQMELQLRNVQLQHFHQDLMDS